MYQPIDLDIGREIEGFEAYVVMPDGTIYTKDSGLKRKPSLTQNGQIKVTLYRDGRSYTKSVALLVAKAWLYNDWNPDVYDTPIHLDNDLTNNHVDNLAWRPRWFAIKYQRQYWHESYRYATTKVQDVKTGEVFNSLLEVCQRYGYLWVDVMNSCLQGESVFPTWHTFRFAT